MYFTLLQVQCDICTVYVYITNLYIYIGSSMDNMSLMVFSPSGYNMQIKSFSIDTDLN